jgi:tetratricopeptide (TPR) repeat protein
MKRKPKDMSDANVLRAEAARMSEDLNRIMRGREFKSDAEFDKFTQGLIGKSFDDIELPELTPQDRAQYLVYDAWEERGTKRRLEMARQALDLWPDCADAYCVLAEEANSSAEERSMLEAAVAAGERAIGTEPFREDVGRFWGIHSTRPYMRARFLFAAFLWSEGEKEAAIKHARDLLRLNPNDNQGVRYTLVGWLLAAGNNRGAVVLLDRYDEATAGWLYARTLIEFRTWGDSDRVREMLDSAFRSNDILPEYLIALRHEPDRLPDSFSLGTGDEAIIVLRDLGEAWQATPGALDWLRDRWLCRDTGKKKR